MIITRLGHAALLVESSSARLLLDPGHFSSDWHGLTGLDAVLITHQHADHIDVDNIGDLLGVNDAARVIVEPAVTAMVGDHPASAAVVGDRHQFGDLSIEVVGGEHAVIHERIPRVGNVGFVISEKDGPTLFHPGDSYATVPNGIDLLALPLAAPWARVAMTIDFANAVKPARLIPIHDAILSGAGRPVYMRMCRGVVEESIAIEDPAIGEHLTV